MARKIDGCAVLSELGIVPEQIQDIGFFEPFGMRS